MRAMSEHGYDAIVVGARCAGSPTAMLLARMGHRVLLVDRARFPSDTISTHLVHPPGLLALRRWGLLDRVVATGCPPLRTYAYDFGDFTIEGSPGIDGMTVAYAPRRTSLDPILVEAATAAGVEVRQGFTVEEIVTEDGRVTGIRGHDQGGRTVTERARVTVGADGRHSVVAASVRPASYHERPPLLAAYYTYFSGLPIGDRVVNFIRPERGFAAWSTNDDLTLVITGWPYAEFAANKRDIAGSYRATLALAPEFAEQVAAAHQEARFVGTALTNYFRTPYGPGWALVGDAGYNKDPITAQGIQDAFRDAELCATALHAALTGERPFDEAMAEYQRTRDEHALAIYEFTLELASLEPPPEDLQRLLAALPGNQEAEDQFARVIAGATSPVEFFDPANVGRILAAA